MIVLHKDGSRRTTKIELNIEDAHDLLDSLTRCIAMAENFKSHFSFEMPARAMSESESTTVIFIVNRRDSDAILTAQKPILH